MDVSDSRNGLSFGVTLSPNVRDIDLLYELAHVADEIGLDLFGIVDHPHEASLLDAWSLMPMLLAGTRRLRVFPNVTPLPLRLPAMMAKAAASLDVLSGGRFELGIGAGYPTEGIFAMGGPVRRPRASIEALEEAIAIFRAMWSGGSGVTFAGQHYALHDAEAGPPLAHPPGIWVGAIGPRMLGLTGRIADGWSAPIAPFLAHEHYAGAQVLIDEAAREAGRDPAGADRQRVGHDRRPFGR